MRAGWRTSLGARVGCFVAVSALAVVASSLYVSHAASRARAILVRGQRAAEPAGGVHFRNDLATVVGQPHLLLIDNEDYISPEDFAAAAEESGLIDHIYMGSTDVAARTLMEPRPDL